jgi:signal transduction histidine kinase
MVKAPSPRPWVAACLVAVALVVARAVLQPFAGQPWHTIACDVISLLRSLFVFCVLLWAARATRPGAPWMLLAAGAASWCIADVIWLVLAVLGTQPWASMADIFFLLTYPLLLAGILALPRQRVAVGGAWAVILDVGVIFNAAVAAMWILLVAPSLAAGKEAGGLTLVIAIAYPVGDLLLLWASLDLLFRGRIRSATGVGPLLVTGAACLILADLIYAVQILHGTYTSGNPLGIVWSLGLVLIGLAGARQATAPSGQPEAARDPRMTTAILGAAALLASWGLLIMHPDDTITRVAAGVSVLLMMLRQLHAQAGNRRLEHDLHAVNSQLEARVAERTEQLAQAQQRLVEAARLEAVGRVAGAVAHDFNNVLTAVTGHADLAKLRCQDRVIQEHLEQILQASGRAAELGRRLIATSRPPATERRRTDLAAIATEVAGQIRPSLPARIELVLDTPPGAVEVLADAGQMHQVIMNLCANARDAMPAGGRIEVKVRSQADRVELSVSDNGCGMGESVRARLFEPYFTTKGEGRGNGLGLATVHAIVRQHGGIIEVESVPGRGSTFRVQVPSGLASVA